MEGNNLRFLVSNFIFCWTENWIFHSNFVRHFWNFVKSSKSILLSTNIDDVMG